MFFSLNPCFNGRYSRSFGIIIKHTERKVLILVLMEDTLGENYEERTMSWGVLILVLMEDTLGVAKTYISLFIAV